MATQSADQQRQRAQQRNKRLAERATRWARLRLALAVLFFGAGCAIGVGLRSLAISFPLLGLGLLFLILFLDASGQAREIRGRRWRRLFPIPLSSTRSTETAASGPRDGQASV